MHQTRAFLTVEDQAVEHGVQVLALPRAALNRETARFVHRQDPVVLEDDGVLQGFDILSRSRRLSVPLKRAVGGRLGTLGNRRYSDHLARLQTQRGLGPLTIHPDLAGPQ